MAQATLMLWADPFMDIRPGKQRCRNCGKASETHCPECHHCDHDMLPADEKCPECETMSEAAQEAKRILASLNPTTIIIRPTTPGSEWEARYGQLLDGSRHDCVYCKKPGANYVREDAPIYWHRECLLAESAHSSGFVTAEELPA
jgi:hypothetical protein